MSTDRTSLIGMLMQAVRRLTFKPLVFLAVLSTTVVLACRDDPSGLGGTGSLVLIVVPYEEAQPAAEADAKGETAAADVAERGPSVAPAAAEVRSPDGAVTQAANAGSAAEAAQQQSRRDVIRITLIGPTSLTQDVTPNPDGSVDVTITDLLVGSYEIQLFGIDNDLGGEVVSEFGRTTGVQVLEDQTRQATISFGSFVPDIDPNITTRTHEFAFDVNYRSVPTATEYLVEADTDPAFSAPTTFQITGTTIVLSVNTTGFIYVRVRAQNASVTFSEARPSDPVAIEVVEDINPTGDTDAAAATLGTVRGANGRHSGYNIFPTNDEDWFSIDLVEGAALTIDVLTSSLSTPATETATLSMASENSAPSALAAVLDVFDPSLTLIATSGDGTTSEARVTDVPINADGTYFLRVTSFSDGSVGNYDLLIDVNATPVAAVSVGPLTATISPSGTVQLTGRTFDSGASELFGREAIWSTSDSNVVTVAPDGLVTGVAVGTATITFSSETISTSATITVSSAVVTRVVITPNSGTIRGIGQSISLTATALDATDTPMADRVFNWYTSNTDVADASAGRIEGVGNGQTVVVAETDGVEGYALATVTDPSATAANYWSDGPASGVPETLFDIWGTSSNAMYAVGAAGRILYNDGTGWTPQTSGVGAGLWRVWGLDEYTVWAVGSGGTIVSTGDVGANWNPETTPTGEFLQGVWGAAINDVFAVGGSGGTGVALHYDGTSWSRMSIPVTTALTSVWGTASDDVFAVGDAGVILHYDGTSWTQMTSPTTEFLRTVWGTSNDDVFAVGTNGTIVHYDGLNWTDMTNPAVTTAFLRSVWGTSSTEVIAVGDGGTIIQYDGVSWSADVSGTLANLWGVFGLPNPGIFAVGDNGTVRLGSRGAHAVVTPNPGNINALGSTLQMAAELQDIAGTVLTSSSVSTWESSDEAIASVDVNGLVTANANGTVTITATLDNFSGTADVTVAQQADAATSTIDAAPSSIAADGAALATVTVQLLDANGNNLTSGGDVVELVTTLGTVSAVTDNGDGSYSTTLTAGTTAGTATITGTVNTATITDDATVTLIEPGVYDGAWSGATSQSRVVSFSVIGDDISRITIGFSITPCGVEGTSFTTLSVPVLVATDGTFSASVVTSPLSYEISGTIDAGTGTASGSVSFTYSQTTPPVCTATESATWTAALGAVDPTTSVIEADPTTLLADGAAMATITVQLNDASGNALSAGGDAVLLTTDAGTLTLVTDNTDGTYTATLTTSTTVETATISGTVNGLDIVDNATVAFTAVPDPAKSEITAVPTSIEADGSSTSTITVQLKDSDAANLAVGGDNVTLATTAGALSAVIDNNDGSYTATLTSTSTAATATVTGTVNTQAIGDNATVAFTGAPDPTTTEITAEPTSIPADGSSTSTITVQVKDSQGANLITGSDIVTLATTAGTLGAVTDNTDGTYTATLTAGITNGTATITGTLNSVAITDGTTVTIESIPTARIEITPSGGTIQDVDQTLQLMAVAFDDQDNVIIGKQISWTSFIPGIAAVDGVTGEVVGVGAGQAVIAAVADGVTAYAVVTVNDAATPNANFWDVHPQASGTTQILRDVWAERKDAVYVVGQTGTVLFNDGTGWAAQTNPATDAVRAIWGVDEFSLVAVGNGGLIMKTVDRGLTWVAERPSPTGLALWDVWGSGLDNVWAAGGVGSIAGSGIIVHYDGSTWTVEPTGPIDHVAAIWGFASDDVWAVGDFGLVLHYDGTGWTVQAAPTGNNFTALWGPGSTDLFAATDAGEVFRYDGMSWAPQSIPASPGLWAIHGTSSSDVYVVGETGTLLHFGGVNWSSLESTATDNLLGVFSTPDGDVIAVGNGGMIQRGTRGATVVVTPDASGITAVGDQVQLSGEVHDFAANVVASGDIFDWTSSDDLIATVGGSGLVTAVANGTVTITASIAGVSGTADVTVRQLAATINVTPDGTNATTTGLGITFSGTADDANANPIPGAAFSWSSLNPNVATINATTGQITAMASGQATIAAELDGAVGYALVNVAIPGAATVDLVSADVSGTTEPMFGIWGTSATDIFAARSQGTVLHYDGTSWTATSTSTANDFKDVWGSSSSDVFAVGNGGSIYHYDGSTWTSMASGTAAGLWTVWGSSPRNVFVGGDGGVLLHYDGSSWNAIVTETTRELRAIWGTSGSDVFVVGTAGTVLHYDGTSLTTMVSNTTEDLLAVWGSSSTDVFAVGRGGIIMRYTGTWAPMTSPITDPNVSLRGLWGSAASDVYAAGDLGTLAYYDGVDWALLPTGTTENLEAIWGTPNPAILMVGANGTIARGSRGATMSVSPTSINLDALGAKQQLTTTATDEDANDVSGVTFLYNSDNASVAEVNATGEVEAFGNGDATITVSVAGGEQTVNVLVTVSQVSAGFGVSPADAAIAVGETIQLSGGSLDANGNPLVPQPPINWSTSDALVASVDGAGLVTANGVGTATITASDGVTDAAANLIVTVANSSVPMAAGYEHNCGVSTDGTVHCWGNNSSGQLGDGTTSTSPSPVQVSTGLRFKSVAAGREHTCGITVAGDAYCWGRNSSGQLGDLSFNDSPVPVAVAGGHTFAQMSVGSYHTCGIDDVGKAFCWGDAGNGRIGDGSGGGSVTAPAAIFNPGGLTFVSIAASSNHSCAVASTGDAYCWGSNFSGELGEGTFNSSTVPKIVVAPGGTTYTAIAVGNRHTCALTSTGAANCWGQNWSGHLGDGTSSTDKNLPVVVTGSFTFRSISAGQDHTCAVTMTDLGYCWGYGYRGRLGDGTESQRWSPTLVTGGLAFVSIDAGGEHTCGRTTTNDIYCWGEGGKGAIGDGTNLTHTPQLMNGALTLSSIDGGEIHSCALDTGGSAHCWGDNSSGQVGDGTFTTTTNISAVLGGHVFSTITVGRRQTCGLLTSDGSAYCWGSNGNGQLGNASTSSNSIPQAVFGGHLFQSITAGDNFTCGVTTAGDAYCWGYNGQGRLGDGTTNGNTSQTIPKAVVGVEGLTFTRIATGNGHACALATDGDTYCWGYNWAGQVGDGTTTTTGTPVKVLGGLTFTSIMAGSAHTCGIDAAGAAYCWGYNGWGQLGNGNFNWFQQPDPVAGGLIFTDLALSDSHTCGVTSTAELYCWGYNENGELGTGNFTQAQSPTLTAGGLSYQAVGLGGNHSCAVTTAGAGYCWGRNTSSQLGNGQTTERLTPTLVTGGLVFESPPDQR